MNFWTGIIILAVLALVIWGLSVIGGFLFKAALGILAIYIIYWVVTSYMNKQTGAVDVFQQNKPRR
jgi:hypothetical protein